MKDLGINDDIVDELVDSILDFSQDQQNPQAQAAPISIENENNTNPDDQQDELLVYTDAEHDGQYEENQQQQEQETTDFNGAGNEYNQNIIDYDPIMQSSGSMHQMPPTSPLDVIPEQAAGFIAQQVPIDGEQQQQQEQLQQLVELAPDSVPSYNDATGTNYDQQQYLAQSSYLPERQHEQEHQHLMQTDLNQQQQSEDLGPIYSTINKERNVVTHPGEQQHQDNDATEYNENYNQDQNLMNIEQQHLGTPTSQSLVVNTNQNQADLESDYAMDRILARRGERGAVESGSFRHNFKKKIPSSVSATDNDLTLHRRKLLETTSPNVTDLEHQPAATDPQQPTFGLSHSAGGSFKRNQLVSFQFNSNNSGQPSQMLGHNSARGNRVSVDIRQLPSYLTNKRASIVEVAKGAVSNLFHSLASGGSSASSHKRDSASSRSPSVGSESDGSDSGGHQSGDEEDDLPIFEEPIAPTLSLGQRVAWVSGDGPEFGTVSWIGQLPDVDDDWVVGVIFDNMIGNTDGQYKGTRYFYSRENYSMFLPLQALTKTDNYIGRPETGTMLSRMSVQLKPGQLISIQRSSIRLQHCFLNAPHQRVGHDVRAVSNRLHCQCHTCGPCAHLTKQGQRIHGPLPHFRAQHTHHDRKKNSLAQAAIELLAHHHHHHFHEEEDHHVENEDHQFGENAAHACNYVRYSCCQQTGVGNHSFLADCEMVRPELLDNLIHAPKAPATTTVALGRTESARAARKAARKQMRALMQQQQPQVVTGAGNDATIKSWQTTTSAGNQTTYTTNTNGSSYYDTMGTMTTQASRNESQPTSNIGNNDGSESDDDDSSSTSTSSEEHGNAINYNDASKSQYHMHQPAIAPALVNRGVAPATIYGNTTQQQQLVPTLMGYSHDTNFTNDTLDMNISLMDQRRFIQQRESSAFVHSRYSYGSQTSVYSESAYSSSNRARDVGSRLRRCFNWCFFISNKDRYANHRNRRSKKHRKNSRRKSNTSTRDKIIEYRRKQSTFVPLTLAKPQEDFASHAILMPNQSNSNSIVSAGDNHLDGLTNTQVEIHVNQHQSPLQFMNGQSPVDYGHSARSSTGDPMRFDGIGLIMGTGDHATDCNEPNFNNNNFHNNDNTTSSDGHGDDVTKHGDGSDSDRILMMKCSPVNNEQQDDNNSPACSCCGDNEKESSQLLLSSQADLGYYGMTFSQSNTTTTSSSNDTLKHIVDECINGQVTAPQPTSEYLATVNGLSPEISLYQNVGENGVALYGEHEYDISSPTASVDVDNQIPPECQFDDDDYEQEQQMQELFDNLAIGEAQLAENHNQEPKPRP